MTEQATKIAANMYRARDAMRNLFAEDYRSRIEPVKELIQKVKEKRNVDELNAAMLCIEMFEKNGNSMYAVLVLAAYVEMIEPTKP